jgi:hypothetical protein
MHSSLKLASKIHLLNKVGSEFEGEHIIVCVLKIKLG